MGVKYVIAVPVEHFGIFEVKCPNCGFATELPVFIIGQFEDEEILRTLKNENKEVITPTDYIEKFVELFGQEKLENEEFKCPICTIQEDLNLRAFVEGE